MSRSSRRSVFLALALVSAAAGCTGSATQAPTGSPPPPPVTGPVGPRAEFKEGTTLVAGDVDYGQERAYTFSIANLGQSPLNLILTGKSCACAKVDAPTDPIPAGGSGKVVVHWAPIVGGEDTVVVHLKTNDTAAAAVDLTVRAKLKRLVHVLIDGEEKQSYIDFGDAPILPNQPRAREVKVFSTELASFSLDASTPVAGLVPEKKPLSGGEHLGEYVVRSGYTVELKATDKMPLGSVHTALNLALSRLGDQPDRTLTIPVYAFVGSASFSVTPEELRFSKPRVTDEDTAKVHLSLTTDAQGDVKVDGWEPKFLKVEARKEPSGKWLITAEMPKDNPDAAKYQAEGFMEGKVAVKAPGIEKPITIRVKWEPIGQ